MTIRVLLVDDQSLFREGLNTLLSGRPDLKVVGEAGDGKEALTVASAVRPDVVLMDLRMPVLDGVAATRMMRKELPESRIIVLTTFEDDEYVFDALRAGAAGYLLKDVSSDTLVEAIHTAARGESFLQPSITTKVVAEFKRMAKPSPATGSQSLVEPLSERELEILALIATGASNKEIAGQLFIAEGTVKNHVTHILGKLGARDRTQAALMAREMGLV